MARRYDCTDITDRKTGLREAAPAVRRGELVVLPTDTVYGIGADAFSPDAVGGLLGAKGRDREMPSPVLVGSPDALHGLVPDSPSRVGAGGGVLAGRADPGRPPPAVAELGPRGQPADRGRPDAAPSRGVELLKESAHGRLLARTSPGAPPRRTATPRRRCSGTPSPSTSTAGRRRRGASSMVDVTGQPLSCCVRARWSPRSCARSCQTWRWLRDRGRTCSAERRADASGPGRAGREMPSVNTPHGRGTADPGGISGTAGRFRILHVSTGNVCRSPLTGG